MARQITFPVVGGRLQAGGSAIGARRAGAAFKSQVSVMEEKLARLRQVLEAEAKKLAAKNRLAFLSFGHGARGGAVWAPLKPSTLATHKRKGWPLLPLLASGKLRNSIRGEVSALHKHGRQWRYTIRVVANEFYGRFHATGYMNKLTGRPVPARPPVQITDLDLHAVAVAIQSAIA